MSAWRDHVTDLNLSNVSPLKVRMTQRGPEPQADRKGCSTKIVLLAYTYNLAQTPGIPRQSGQAG